MTSKSLFLFTLLSAILYLSSAGTLKAQKSGQQLIDSLIAELPSAALDTNKVNLLNSISWDYKRIDPEKGVEYGEQGAALANQINWTKGKAKAQISIGTNYFFSGAYEDAIPKLLEALEYAEQIQLTPKIAQSAMILGLSYDRTNQYESALKYYLRSIEPYKQIGKPSSIMTALSNTAKMYQQLSRYPEALTMANELYEFSKKNSPGTREAKALDLIGSIYLGMSNYPLALQYLLDALEIYEQYDDRKGMADGYLSIGVVYQSLKEYDKALEYYHKSLVIFKELGDEESNALILTDIGSVYHTRSQHKEAKSYYEQALEIYEGYENHENICMILCNMGGISLGEKDYALALELLERSLVTSQESEDRFQGAVTLGHIGSTYHQIGATEDSIMLMKLFDGNKLLALEAALLYTDSAIAILVDLKELRNRAFYIDQRSLIEADLGHYDNALESYKQSIEIKDSLFNIERDKKLVQAEMGYEFGRREDSLNLQSAKQQLALQNQIELQTLAYEYAKKEAAAQSEQEKQQLAHDEALKRQDIQNEYSRKQAAAESLSQQKELQRKQAEALNMAELRRQRIIRNLSLLGALGLLVFSVVAYRQRNKVKREKARSEELLLNILPAEIAEELKEKGKADARDFDLVSILFSDFKGFTAASEKLSAQELVAEISTCFEAFDGIMGKYGIEKIKTIGDAYMAAGGLPVPKRDSVRNTVLAALEMQGFIEERRKTQDAIGKPAFAMRVGIHTGPVVAGIVGVKKFQYDIWGDTVNTASRMESSGGVGQVNISQATYELLKDASTALSTGPEFSFESRGKIEAKGKGEIEMYFVSLKTEKA